MATSTDDTQIADLSAEDLIHCLDYPSPYRDLVDVLMVDGQTLMIVGYRVCTGLRKIVTGRIAWLRRDSHAWRHECRSMADDGEIVDPASGWTLTTMADVHRAIAWAKGAA